MAAEEESAGLLRTRQPTPAGGKLLILLQYGMLVGFVGFVAMHPALHSAVPKHVVPTTGASKAPPRPHVAASALKVANLAKPHLGSNPRPVGVRKGRAKTKMRAVQPGRRESLLSEAAPMRSPLPERVALCYASWSECDDRIILAARQGCNVNPQTPNPKS